MARSSRSRNRNTRAMSVTPSAPVVDQDEPTPEVESQQLFLVVIENLMAQALEVSVLNEAGETEGVRIAPRGKSRPISVDRVGRFTHDLVARGRVRIVPIS